MTEPTITLRAPEIALLRRVEMKKLKIVIDYPPPDPDRGPTRCICCQKERAHWSFFDDGGPMVCDECMCSSPRSGLNLATWPGTYSDNRMMARMAAIARFLEGKNVD